MKRGVVILATLVCVFMIALSAQAGEYKGTIQGLQCAVEGKLCPVGYEDALIAMESTFVLVDDSKNWYVLPNLDRSVLARHVNEEVLVIGKKHDTQNSIRVEKLQVKTDKGWDTVWSAEKQNELRDLLWGPGGNAAHPRK